MEEDNGNETSFSWYCYCCSVTPVIVITSLVLLLEIGM